MTGLYLIVVAVLLGYRKAKRTGRRPALWAVITGAVFLGAQVFCIFTIVAALFIGAEFAGWSEDLYIQYAVHINIFSTVIAFAAVLVVFYYLDRPARAVPVDPGPPPPPPPEFKDDI